MAILRRQRQLVWGIVESNGFKFSTPREKMEKFSEKYFEIYYYVLYCICKCFMECSSFSSARMGGDDVMMECGTCTEYFLF